VKPRPPKTSTNALVPKIRSLQRSDASRLQPHADLTYTRLEGVEVVGASVYQSIFTGSLLRDCTFREVDFRRADLDACRFEQCRFIGCDFSASDIRFATFAGCDFQGCKLNGAVIRECSFEDVKISQSSFVNAVLDGDVFVRSVMEDCGLTKSSYVHGRSQACTYRNIDFDDCSFLYQTMIDCEFTQCAVSVEYVGLVFGLTPQNLASFRYYFIGERRSRRIRPSDLGILLDEYAKRGWAIGLAILRMTLEATSVVYAISEYIRFLETARQAAMRSRREELGFLVAVMTELARQERLPLLACWLLAQLLAREAQVLQGGLIDEVERGGLDVLHTRVQRLAISIAERVEETNPFRRGTVGDATVALRLTFERHPTVDIVRLIKDCVHAAGDSNSIHPRVVAVRDGSVIVWLVLSTIAFVSLRRLIAAITGCVQEVGRLTLSMQMAALIYEARSTDRTPSSGLATRDDGAAILRKLHRIMIFAASLRWLSDPNLGGLGRDNLKKWSATLLKGAPEKTHRKESMPGLVPVTVKRSPRKGGRKRSPSPGRKRRG
jgi:hypothetical protein